MPDVISSLVVRDCCAISSKRRFQVLRDIYAIVIVALGLRIGKKATEKLVTL